MHGAEQCTADLAVRFNGFHSDRTVPEHAEAVNCSMQSLDIATINWQETGISDFFQNHYFKGYLDPTNDSLYREKQNFRGILTMISPKTMPQTAV